MRNDKEVDLIRHVRKNTGDNTGAGLSKNQEGNIIYDCLKCGRRHTRMNCPTWGKKCINCGKQNHFAAGCMKKQNNHTDGRVSSNSYYNKQLGKRNVHTAQTNVELEDSDTLFIDTISVDNILTNSSDKSWTIDVVINDKIVTFKLDTGASCNCLPLNQFYKLGYDDSIINHENVSIGHIWSE